MDAVEIRPTTLRDTGALPAVERSAAEAFRSIAELTWVADDPLTSVQEHDELAAAGTSWVAVDGDTPVGFLCAEVIGDELHVWELAVREDCQRRGLGRRLVDAAVASARDRRLAGVTLTTFSDVPWNAPFYARLGFVQVAGQEAGPRLGRLLGLEAERGLPRRCAMRLPLHA